ncbi:MAG: 23S rRNA (guanosine(2251)-2'-O)-methyltransferase RlmB [Pseudomonadota bacterium]
MAEEALEYVVGLHAVGALVRNGPGRIRVLYYTDDVRHLRRAKVIDDARSAGVPVASRTRAELDDLVAGQKHQGVVAHAAPGVPESFSELILRLNDNRDAFVLVLDGIQDPGNLGACLRTAAAAGIDAVVVPRAKATELTPAARRAASGAAELVPVVSVPNLARAIRALQAAGLTVVGADGDAAESLPQATLSKPLAVVVGAEGGGLRRLTRDVCDSLVSIPLPGALTTLNVSVAVGIVLYEVCRDG